MEINIEKCIPSLKGNYKINMQYTTT